MKLEIGPPAGGWKLVVFEIFLLGIGCILFLLIPSRLYAQPAPCGNAPYGPCAALDQCYSQCVPNGSPTPTPVNRYCGNPGNPGVCNWYPVNSTTCQGQCYISEDSCGYHFGLQGACFSNVNTAPECNGWVNQGTLGCAWNCDVNNPNTSCYCYAAPGAGTPAPTPGSACTPTPRINLSATPISVQNPCPNDTCQTAIGNIGVKSGSSFVQALFGVLLSLSGGIALILIIYSGYNMAMSQGNPEKVKGAQETLTAAIIGLLFVILSVAILQIIGVDIIRLPGFSSQ